MTNSRGGVFCRWLVAACLVAASAQAAGRNYSTNLVDAERQDRPVGLNVFMPESSVPGPYPLVVFSHGFGETFHAYDYLGTALADAGYAVVFVNHAGSDADALKGGLRGNLSNPDNLTLRPQDVRFALDRIAAADPAVGRLANRADMTRVAVAGHSLGSTTALQAAGATVRLADGNLGAYGDPRVRAAIAMSPQIWKEAGGQRMAVGLHRDSWADVSVPVLVMWGTADTGFGALARDPSLRMEAYESLGSKEKYAVIIEGAEHHVFTETDPWYPGGPRDPRHHKWITAIVQDFLDAVLEGDPRSRQRLVEPRFANAKPGEIEVVASVAESAAAETVDDPAGTAEADRDFEPLDAFLEQAVVRYRMADAVMLVAERDGTLVYQRSFGDMGPDSPIPVASHSKWFAAATVMRLVERGLVGLDDPVSRYLSEFARGNRKADITLRHTLAFTSGLPHHDRRQDDPSISQRELARYISTLPLEDPPGTAFRYGGLQMELAGAVAEVVTGKPYRDIFRDEIVRPLELTDTRIGNMRGRRAQDIVYDTANPLVPGGVVTTARDSLRFALMLLNDGQSPDGARILSVQSAREMLRDQTDGVPIKRTVQPDDSYRYGLGGWVHPLEDGTLHISSEGGLGATPWIDPARGYAAVFFTVTDGGKLQSFRPRLKELVNGIWDGEDAAAPTAAESAEPAEPAEPAESNADRKQFLARAFRHFDRDGNGYLDESEAPPKIARFFTAIDRNRDGRLSEDEVYEVLQRQPRTQGGAGYGQGDMAAAGSQQADKQEAPAAVVSDGVTMRTVQLADRSRDKTLTSDIYAPAGTGPYPVVLVSHFAGGVREAYAALAAHWASRGMVVVVPDHIDSPNEGGRRGAFARRNWPDRVADLAFLASSLGDIAANLGRPASVLDGSRIGLVGHYIGALAAAVAAGAETTPSQDVPRIPADRVAAILLMSPQGPGQITTDRSWQPLYQPMMVVTGSEDASNRTGNPPEWRAQVFHLSPPPDKYLAWFEGLDGRYGGVVSLEGGSLTDTELAADVAAVTTAFLEAYIHDDPQPLRRLLTNPTGAYRIESK